MKIKGAIGQVVAIANYILGGVVSRPQWQLMVTEAFLRYCCLATQAMENADLEGGVPTNVVFMDYLRELEGKRVHDPFNKKMERSIVVAGPVIVGAGPSGLATAVCLKEKGISSLILERADCIASMWQHKTYDRLRLHLPKQFCQLPRMQFPENYPTYPNKHQFLEYLEAYANRFGLEPVFNKTVVNAEYDHRYKFWRVKTVGIKQEETEYVCQWLIVATGENAEEVVPRLEGMDDFDGIVIHSSSYRSGEMFRDKSVLVVGCGNSGMEVCLDLCNYNARPSLVVRDAVHILPREIIGRSTFGLSTCLLKWFPVRLVDLFLLVISWFVLGDTSRFGLRRPKLGPLQFKHLSGKTPVLDVGTIAKIKSGDIKVFPGIEKLTQHGVKFTDGRESDMFSEKDGFPRKAFPNGWKGASGLYAVGFSRRGLLGVSMDARKIAEDVQFHCLLSCSTPTLKTLKPNTT
ncbi:hypothetical protein EZV62_012745 [Acer yangbiense]|uniref:indole-3-pyruvate monooxygenase n=1 Tax=Acer yangbiense TaxID=1000413 RepID=A0A5C7HYZ2_9ROSI|nr:hypothetical protein EZV62_012745 [Acer yangbiense]